MISTDGTTPRVALTGADQLLLAARNRVGATIYNDQGAAGTANLYVLLVPASAQGAAGQASATNFTVMLPPGGYYETPFGWAGAIRGFSTAATGNAQMTELV